MSNPKNKEARPTTKQGAPEKTDAVTSSADQAAVNEITRLHDEIHAAAHTSLEKAMRIGDLLKRIKTGLQHGEWLPWVAAHLPFTDRTARNYIRVYDNRERLKSETVSDLSEVYRLLTTHRELDFEVNIDDEHDFEGARLTTYARIAELKSELESLELAPRRCAEIMREGQGLQNIWEGKTLEAERELGRALNQIKQLVSAAPWPELLSIYPDLLRRRKREPEVDGLWHTYPETMSILETAHASHICPHGGERTAA